MDLAPDNPATRAQASGQPNGSGSDRSNAVLLLAGLTLGLVLGPWVLGRYANGAYQRWFMAGRDNQKALEVFDQDTRDRRGRLADSGVTPQAMAAFDLSRTPQRDAMEMRVQLAQETRANQLFAQMAAVVGAVAAIMLAESLVKDQGVRRRLATARYALLAVWLAVTLASSMWRRMHIVFALMLVIVAVSAALVPIGRRGGPSPR